ncbi:MAG: M20/M25/M40 family metallo-hydrolase [candidate division Zixibacteria bacterium]|nr:M20/M25/M40 family metallo-hydrolase [candidate division Zixibacteria bacterium]
MTRCYYVLALIVVTVLASTALANDSYLIVVENLTGDNQSQLNGFPGRAWGKTIDKVYLYGSSDEIVWLENRNITYKTIIIDNEPSLLYLNYDVNSDGLADDQILDSGSNYVLSDSRLPGADSYRRMALRKLPFEISDNMITDVLEYHPTVDGLISEVNIDSLMTLLGELSGETAIEIDGEVDTILTRYSGTYGNELAAAYIMEILENYGYQVEYHAFFGGELRHIAGYDDEAVWMVDENSFAYKTVNGGVDWDLMPVNSGSALWGVDNIGSDSVWVSGNNGTIKFSSDGGESFVTQNSGTGNYLFGLCFISPDKGWVAGDEGMILHTSNGGQDWTGQPTPTGQRLYDVCFVDTAYGWTVGRNGAVLHTTDGGATWNFQTSGTSERLYGVQFTDRNNGWTVGWNGVVRHTTDGGANWETVYLGDNIEKYHVEFTDADHGCIVGWNGGIYITANGGDDWVEMNSGTSKDLYGVEFVDNQTGYALGDGVVLKTTDGGQTWIDQSASIEGAWRNVIATKIGTTDPDDHVIICAHMDCTSEIPQTRAPGADDNGSGTVAVIEAARIYADVLFEKTVKFCLWTGEEQGLHGSAAYAADAYARGDNIVGAYNFDMIGWDGDGDHHGELHCGTMTQSIEMGDLFENVITDYSLDMNTDLLTYNSTTRSDHASFWDYNYPAILGIEDFTNDFHPYYHTTQDNVDNINQPFFFEYVKGAVGATASLAIPDTLSTGVNEIENLPGSFTLISNYPNPFNAATTISFNLPERAEIELLVYDLLGRKVATLHQGTLGAGTHRLTWNANDYTSGLYFYRLDAGEQSAMGRMVLLK